MSEYDLVGMRDRVRSLHVLLLPTTAEEAYERDVTTLLDALEAALASIRWRDMLAEEWSTHMRALEQENERLRKLLSRAFALCHPHPALGRDIRAALATPPPAEHTYARGPET